MAVRIVKENYETYDKDILKIIDLINNLELPTEEAMEYPVKKMLDKLLGAVESIISDYQDLTSMYESKALKESENNGTDLRQLIGNMRMDLESINSDLDTIISNSEKYPELVNMMTKRCNKASELLTDASLELYDTTKINSLRKKLDRTF